MGIRMHQYIGLTEDAQKWLKENVKEVTSVGCPKCGCEISTKMSSRQYSTGMGMFEDEFFYLLEYDLKDGRIVQEILQAQPWNSGPMSFLCLELDGEKIFMWTEEEMSTY